jgi:hypothetical protein
MENALELLVEDIFPKLDGRGVRNEPVVEGLDGWDGEDNIEWPLPFTCCPGVSPFSTSPLPSVRLPPDSVRKREVNCLMSLAFDNRGDGGSLALAPPHSWPRAAACAKIFRRNFLLFSNCTRAAS